VEDAFLDEINVDLPPGVDWKQGAIDYLREIVADGGPSAERYHLIKPYMGGPDFEMFWTASFEFLDVVKKLDLPSRARVIDVGCGPGWTVQWLARLGHEVIGLDISQELLAIAEQRMQNDPYPPHVGEAFLYELRAHDIESTPLDLDEPVDVALFAATLHHFYNPVAALRNVAVDLKEDGIVAVIEAAAPDKGTTWHVANVDLMTRYHTIERPYTRDQLVRMLELAGLSHVQFYRPVNGLFRQDADSVAQVSWEIAREQNINLFFAAKNRDALARVEPTAQSIAQQFDGFRFLDGFFGAEAWPDGRQFRWSTAQSLIRLGLGAQRLSLANPLLAPGEPQTIRALCEGQLLASATLAVESPHASLDLTAPNSLIELQSDRVFSPSWHGGGDTRVLAFTLDAS
jgi:SAM-dependent methyltransferase